MKSHLVIGCKGQVGSAVMELLSGKFQVVGVDLDTPAPVGDFDVLHICIPFYGQPDSLEGSRESFTHTVRGYQRRNGFDNALVIIHSTVPLGTSAKLGAVHSPVRGVHPNLLEGLRTFVKYFGGPRAEEAAGYFAECGLVCRTVKSARDTEALKLWDTTQYGLNIILEKSIHSYCEEHGLDFDTVYTDANRTYNQGFYALGKPEYSKYILEHVDGPIGGHCVLPNCELLDSHIADFVASGGHPMVRVPLGSEDYIEATF
jgi:hypothetical protein